MSLFTIFLAPPVRTDDNYFRLNHRISTLRQPSQSEISFSRPIVARISAKTDGPIAIETSESTQSIIELNVDSKPTMEPSQEQMVQFF